MVVLDCLAFFKVVDEQNLICIPNSRDQTCKLTDTQYAANLSRPCSGRSMFRPLLQIAFRIIDTLLFLIHCDQKAGGNILLKLNVCVRIK